MREPRCVAKSCVCNFVYQHFAGGTNSPLVPTRGIYSIAVPTCRFAGRFCCAGRKMSTAVLTSLFCLV